MEDVIELSFRLSVGFFTCCVLLTRLHMAVSRAVGVRFMEYDTRVEVKVVSLDVLYLVNY